MQWTRPTKQDSGMGHTAESVCAGEKAAMIAAQKDPLNLSGSGLRQTLVRYIELTHHIGIAEAVWTNHGIQKRLGDLVRERWMCCRCESEYCSPHFFTNPDWTESYH